MGGALFSRLAKQAGWLFSGNSVAALASLVSVALIARGLGLSDFGYFILAQTYVMVLSLLLGFQTWQPTVKFACEKLEENDSKALDEVLNLALVVDIATNTLVGGVVFLVLVLLRDALSLEAEQFAVILALMPVVLFNISGFANGLLRILDRYAVLAKVQVYFAGIRLLFLILVFVTSNDLLHYALAWAASEVIYHLILILVALRARRNRFGLRLQFFFPQITKHKKFLEYMWFNNIDVSVRMISRQLDVVLIGLFVGKEQVGLYRIAVLLCSVPLRITDPFYQVLLPEYIRLRSKGSISAIKDSMKRFSFIGLGLFVLSFLGFYLLGEWLIAIFFGEQYLSAFGVALVYLVAIGGALVGMPLTPFYHAYGEARFLMRVQILITLAYLSLLIPLVMWIGAMGAAIAYVAYYVFWLCLVYTRVNRVLV